MTVTCPFPLSVRTEQNRRTLPIRLVQERNADAGVRQITVTSLKVG